MDTHTPPAAVSAAAAAVTANDATASPPALRELAASSDTRSDDIASHSASATSCRSTRAPSHTLVHRDRHPHCHQDRDDTLATPAAEAAGDAEAGVRPAAHAAALSLAIWQAHRAHAVAYFTAAARALPGESIFGQSPDLDSGADDAEDDEDGGAVAYHASRKAAAWLLSECGAVAPPPAASAHPDAHAHLHESGTQGRAACPFSLEEPATATTAWRADGMRSPVSPRPPQAREEVANEEDEACARSGSSSDDADARAHPSTVTTTTTNTTTMTSKSQALTFCPTPATRTHAGAWRHRGPSPLLRVPSPTPPPPHTASAPSPPPPGTASDIAGAASVVEAARWRDAPLHGRASKMNATAPSHGGGAVADAATESDEESAAWEDWADDVFDEGGAMQLAELVLCVPRLLLTLLLRYVCCGCACVTAPLRWLRRRRPCVCGGAVCILCLDCLPLGDSEGEQAEEDAGDEEEEEEGAAAVDNDSYRFGVGTRRGWVVDQDVYRGVWAASHRFPHAYHSTARGAQATGERRPLLSSRTATARPLHLAGPDSEEEDEEEEGAYDNISSGGPPSRTRHTIPTRATSSAPSPPPLPPLPLPSRGVSSATAKRDGGGGMQATDRDRRAAETAPSIEATRRLRCAWVPTSVRRAAVSCRRAAHRTIDFYRVWECPHLDKEAASHSGVVLRSSNAGATTSAPPATMTATSAEAAAAAGESAAAAVSPPPLPRRPLRRRAALMRLPRVGRVYVTLQYVALIVLAATVAMLGVFAYRRTRVAAVHDETACNTFSFEDRVQADLSFSLICFMVNGLLAVRFAVRAVRYEKGGLLVVQAVVVALQVCRAVYFVPVVATSYMRAEPAVVPPPTTLATPSSTSAAAAAATTWADVFSFRGGGAGHPVRAWAPSGRGAFGSGSGGGGSSSSSFSDSASAPTREPGRPRAPVLEPLFALTCVGVASSVALFIFSALLTPWVRASFGWRQYEQGIVQVSLLRVRQRLTILRTCVQLDSVTTANAYLATVFLLDNWDDQAMLLLATGSVLALHYVLIAALRRAQHWWPLLCAVTVLITVSGYYAAVIGATLQADHQLRTRSSAPWFSTCYTEQLPRCLDGISPTYPVSIYRDHQDECAAGGGVREAGAKARLVSLRRAAAQAARIRTPHQLLSAHAVHAVPAVQRVRNTTHTYLPTEGTFPDYFQVSWCNAACFADEEASSHHALQRGIAGCCARYGQCRLKDAYRTYAVLLLLLLVLASFVVRVVLLAVAWGRWVEEDDTSIERFLRERHRRRGAPRRAVPHSQRPRARPTRPAAPLPLPQLQPPHSRSSSSGGGPAALVGPPAFSAASSPVQRFGPHGLSALPTPRQQPASNALFSGFDPAAPPPPPAPPQLLWNAAQYALWRERQEAQERVG